jgi:hypothetical protein
MCQGAVTTQIIDTEATDTKEKEALKPSRLLLVFFLSSSSTSKKIKQRKDDRRLFFPEIDGLC